MSTYRIHTRESAPEASRPALLALEKAFGFIPNIAGAIAASPVLINCLVAVFERVHTGSFSEAEIQVVLLTDAVANAAAWPVALHSKLAVEAGIDPADVAAICSRRPPAPRNLAALSGLARALIEQRGHVGEPALAAFQAAGYDHALVLEVVAIVAASTMTNYAASVANPPLEEALAPYAWTM